MYVFNALFLIDFGHDGASFVVILLFDNNRIWVYKMGNDPISDKMGSPTPSHFIGPVRRGICVWGGSLSARGARSGNMSEKGAHGAQYTNYFSGPLWDPFGISGFGIISASFWFQFWVAF